MWFYSKVPFQNTFSEVLPEKGGPASGLLRSPCFPNWKRRTWLASEREIIFVCCNTHIPYSSPSKHDLSSGFCDKYLQFLIFTISHCANMGSAVLSPHKRLRLNSTCAHRQLHSYACSTGWSRWFWFWFCRYSLFWGLMYIWYLHIKYCDWAAHVLMDNCILMHVQQDEGGD